MKTAHANMGITDDNFYALIEAFVAARSQAPDIELFIVGGGPTGVELAGALGEIANDTLRHDFRHINPREAAIKVSPTAKNGGR